MCVCVRERERERETYIIIFCIIILLEHSMDGEPTDKSYILTTVHGIGSALCRLLAFVLPAKSYLVYIIVSTVLLKSAACIDLAWFCQLPCAKYFRFPMLIYKGFKGV